MKMTAFFLAAAALAGTALGDPESPWTLTTERKFSFSYEAGVTPPAGAKKVRLWFPVPQTDAFQTIERLEIRGSVPHTVGKDPVYGNSFAYLEAAGPITATMTFVATRRENAGGPKGALSKDEEAVFLKGDALAPLDNPDMLAMREKAIGKTAGATDAARKAYDHVLAHMAYDKSGTGWGRGDLVHACGVGKGNCTDYHALFIGMLRASRIPARFEIGFSLPVERGEGEVKGYHCWALFHDPARGWVPVDASEADKDLSLAEFYFGRHSTNRVKFTTGRDLALVPRQDGPPLNYLVHPYAEADGKPVEATKKFGFKDLAKN